MFPKFFNVLSVFVASFSILYAQEEGGVLAVQTHQLDNGFMIYLNQDTTVTNVFGAVVVNAGSKDESLEATGMAHYLEHMLFKGTTTMGTSNYEAEKVHLDSISFYYEKLSKTTDEQARKAIQLAINEQSIKAAKYGLPTEFQSLLKSIGSKGINAFTSYDMTFYHNQFPAHEMDKWLDLYAARFQNPVLRSFQSELEVVYEEKNRSADEFVTKLFERINNLLFPNIPYGQWTPIGKTEHLKNPPLKATYEFFDRNYVPNNMALVLTGNFDPKDVLPSIEAKFGPLKRKEYSKKKIAAPTPIKGVTVERVNYTPISVGILGYQTVAEGHPDRVAMDVCEYLLSNFEETGFVDQILANDELMFGGVFPNTYNEAGSVIIFYVPKIIVQSLKSAEKKVLGAMNKLREGDFDEGMLATAKINLSKEFQQELEPIDGRGISIGEVYCRGEKWEDYLKYPEKIAQVTKEDVLRVAAKYLGDDYIKIVSKTGFPKKEKLAKPGFKPVVTDQKEESAYAKEFKKIPSKSFNPRFIDFDKDVNKEKLKGGHEILAVNNPINNLFQLNLNFKIGTQHDLSLRQVADIMNSVGAGEHDLNAFKRQFANLGCTYTISADANEFNINLEGEESNLGKGLELLNLLFTEPQEDAKAKSVLLNNMKADRKLEKKTPTSIADALKVYAMHGNESSYLKRASIKEVKSTDLSTWIDRFKELTSQYSAQIVFTGKTSSNELKTLIEQKLKLTSSPKKEERIYTKTAIPEKTKIYFIHQKQARQSNIYLYLNGEKMKNEQYATVKAFNEYFSGGFSGLLMQEIREYRSLAYSTWGNYFFGAKPDMPGYLTSYIGCQADKTVNAIEVMLDILEDLPAKEERIATLQKSLKTKAMTDYPNFRFIANYILYYQQKGFDADPNRKAYKEYEKLGMQNILDFYKKTIKGKPMTITICGDKRQIDLEKLKKIGEVVELKASDVMSQ
ncbi:MAG: insulinase family protein [Aureispira sp.]|nr:insulinase family protein [Aureispira sp.]